MRFMISPSWPGLTCPANIEEPTRANNHIDHIDTLATDRLGDRDTSARRKGGGEDISEHGFLAYLTGATWRPVEAIGKVGGSRN